MRELDEWVAVGIPEEIVDQAAEWIVVLDRDYVSIPTREAFASWLDSDLLHRWAYEELSAMWAKDLSVDAFGRGITHLLPNPPETQQPGLNGWQAALVVSCLILGVALGIAPPLV